MIVLATSAGPAAPAAPAYWAKSAPTLDGVEYATVPVEWKATDDGSGEVEGYAATFGNVDLQGDMILKGAFKRTLDHWASAKGRIPLVDGHMAADTERLLGSVASAKEDAVGLRFRAVFSEVQRAQDARRKAIEGHLTGVSIGWLPDPGVPDAITFQEGSQGIVRVLKAIRLLEISLTPIPANPEATLTAAKTAIGPHSTGTTDSGRWDAAANERRLPNSAAALRAAHAWREPGADPDAKSSYKFIHHVVAEGGQVGAAHLTGCSAAIAVLNGGRGGANIPDADRRGVWNHVAAHLRAGDREPPALKALPLPYEELEAGLRAALLVAHKGARQAAVDSLIAAYHTAPDAATGTHDDATTAAGHAGTGPPAPSGDGSGDPPAGTPPVSTTSAAGQGDPHGYALRFLASSKKTGPPDGAPGAGPPTAPGDPLLGLEAGHAARRVDDLLAEFEEGGAT
jgi:HK97 family phage prohead protease